MSSSNTDGPLFPLTLTQNTHAPGEWAVCCERALGREKRLSTGVYRYYCKMTNSHHGKFYSQYITNDTMLPIPNCQATSNCRQAQLWLFLFWILNPWRFCLCKTLRAEKINLKSVTSPQCKVCVPSENSWAGPAGGSWLCLFSGPHNKEVKLRARELFQRMRWESDSHWFEWAAIFVSGIQLS